ncbi:hypothetical protein [Krasilnikovia sp. M28-CT-15]|uniref:hypothetical protein n=1 Tax=Krasilnikovia sp. M28-CT-15 TaxID=3373540 RepID=UPI00399CEFD5
MIGADAIRLICEVTSPNTAATDKVLKMHYYAAAVTTPGEVLVLTDPVEATIKPEELLPPG